jgi:DNA-binding transcriptional MerR regulator
MDQLLHDAMDIREVARRTGLTSRALRFYEARGLLNPLRTNSGRRLYGRAELERIQQIVALKRAGLTLSQIAKLTERGPLDLGALVDAQLKLIDERRAELDEARSLLLSIKSRIGRGEPVDAATFCSLIREGDRIMQPEDWKKVTGRYFSKEEMAQFAEHSPPADFDQAEYSRKWADLGKRVQAAIPLGPDSAEAHALYDEWMALLKPFLDVATPQMLEGAKKLYEKLPEWENDVPAPFTSEAYAFIREVGKLKKAG